MKRIFCAGLIALAALPPTLQAATGEDDREKVKLPAMMKTHMPGNMRDHRVN